MRESTMTERAGSLRLLSIGLLMLTAIGAGGCNELVAIGRFSVGDAGPFDAAGRDGGPGTDASLRDAGPDAELGPDGCVLFDFYRDSDGDNFGDPDDAMSACEMPAGYVANDRDCDDGSADIHPGITETCDAVDQDCDGAIDEGLLGFVGTPIEIEPSLGIGGGIGWSVVSHATGNAVVWRRSASDFVLASFYDLSGTLLNGNVSIAGSAGAPATYPLAIRFRVDGLDQIYVTWQESDGLHGTLCSTTGDCGSDHNIISLDPSTIEDVGMAQLGDRVIIAWNEGTDARLTSIDPRLPIPGTPLTIADTEITTGMGIQATVDGPVPYTLLARAGAVDLGTLPSPDDGVVLDGGVTYFSGTELIRVRGNETLAFDPSTDVFDWDGAQACRDLGAPYCALVGATFIGQGTVDEPSLFGVEMVAGFNSLNPDGGTITDFAGCAMGGTPRSDRAPDRGDCYRPPNPLFNVLATRGSVALISTFVGTGWAVREVGLGPDVGGGSLVPFPIPPGGGEYDQLLTGAGILMSASDNHAALIVNGPAGGFDMTLLQLGCTP